MTDFPSVEEGILTQSENQVKEPNRDLFCSSLLGNASFLFKTSINTSFKIIAFGGLQVLLLNPFFFKIDFLCIFSHYHLFPLYHPTLFLQSSHVHVMSMFMKSFLELRSSVAPYSKVLGYFWFSIQSSWCSYVKCAVAFHFIIRYCSQKAES